MQYLPDRLDHSLEIAPDLIIEKTKRLKTSPRRIPAPLLDPSLCQTTGEESERLMLLILKAVPFIARFADTLVKKLLAN